MDLENQLIIEIILKEQIVVKKTLFRQKASQNLVYGSVGLLFK